jgi:hypothetical protein
MDEHEARAAKSVLDTMYDPADPDHELGRGLAGKAVQGKERCVQGPPEAVAAPPPTGALPSASAPPSAAHPA